MLILTRRIGESIIIGDNITLTVLGINKHKQIKLGIDAPKETSVHREEIFLKIQGQKEGSKELSITGKEAPVSESPGVA